MKQEYFKFKKLFTGFGCSLGMIGVVVGILSLVELVPVNINGKPYYGMKGLCGGVLFGGMATVSMTCFSYIFLNIGVFVFNLFSGQQR